MVKAKKMRILCLAVFFLTIFAGLGSTPALSATALTDISDHWAYAEIQSLLDQGIIYGDTEGTFRPDDSINRAEFLTMINRAFDYTAADDINFTDVRAGDWYYQEVAKAVKAGYINGFTDGSMRPDSDVTRQEAAAIMARILDLDTTREESPEFTDYASIPIWSRGAIGAMVQAGFMQTFVDGSFRPFVTISRAEAAVLIYDSMRPSMPVTGVMLNRSSVDLYAGDELTLTATIRPSGASNTKVNWSSSDEGIATVSSTGKVTAEGEGNCTITVTTADGRFQDNCRIVVLKTIRVEDVSLDESSIDIAVGERFTLYGSISPDDATNQKVGWSSSDSSVATVNSLGRVTGVGEGSAVITVKTGDGGYYDTCKVTVRDEGYINLNLDAMTIYLHKTPTAILYAYLNEDDSNILGVIWESDNEEVATVDYDDHALRATVTAVDTGSCTITIEVVTEEGEYHKSCKVWVED